MIEKLELPSSARLVCGKDYDLAFKYIKQTVNELVDAVNSIVSVQEKLIDSRFAVETKHEEPADPYAEQRRWEGKLCWFWDEDPEDKIVGVLSCIDTSDKYPYVMCDRQVHYKHCEPVKPDDDIIYKGEIR